MTRTISALIFSLLSVLAACNSSSQTENKYSKKIDTTNAIRIDNYWTVPKEKFDFASTIEGTGDTLTLLICGDYAYSPFGQLTDKSQIKSGLLKNFNFTDRVDTTLIGILEFQILNLKSSRLILFIDNTATTRSSYVMKGDINDNIVNFDNGVKIGMAKENFMAVFFDNFPRELISKYNIIAFETCLKDLRHTYIFDDNKLKSVNFKSHAYWKVDY
jgi:hypothetical protein